MTGRIGFAGDMAHDMGVNRFVRRPSDLPSESTDFLPPIPGGFTDLVSQTTNWWCANHELGATLCSYRVQRPTGIPHP
jgi:hypothetical protein